jgi:RND family efflux transporter MFP subunit
VTPLRHEVVEWKEYPGRLAAPQTVTVSARVSGIIESAPFPEGALVQSGDELFIIDERPFRAEYQAKVADLSAAEAQLSKAQAHFKRYEQLKGSKAISAEDYDQALANLEQARANIEIAQAAVEIAKLNLEWTRVLAPITGLVSRKYVTEGNLITGGAGQATPLTSITSIDPMHAYVNAPEHYLFTYRKILAALGLDAGQKLPCSAAVGQEDDFSYNGVIDFVDNQVNAETGTVEVRCAIPNAQRILSAGLFTRLRIPGSAPYKALLIPETAVGSDQASRFVLVVGADGKVQHKAVELGALFGTLRAVTSGLSPEDRVVVTGLQQLRPGTEVTVVPQAIPQEAIQKLPDPASLRSAVTTAVPTPAPSTPSPTAAAEPGA